MSHRRLVPALLVAFVLIGCQDTTPTELPLAESPSFARATFTEISGTMALDGLGSCSAWRVPSGIYKERDCETHYTVTGGVGGEGWLIEKASFNFSTGNGVASGPIDLSVTGFLGNEVEGTLSGHVTYRCKGWWCKADYVLHGAGELEGLKLKTAVEGWFTYPGTFSYTATIIDPHGG